MQDQAIQESRVLGTGGTTLPSEYFFIPGRDLGMSFLRRPQWILRQCPGAQVRQYACSDFENVQALLEDGLQPDWSSTRQAVFEINSVPVLSEGTDFKGGSARIGKKYLLNGASGDRVLSRYLKLNPGLPAFRQLNRFFAKAKSGGVLDIPCKDVEISDLPLGIECRNRRNFYHFITESFPILAHFVRQRPRSIVFHCRSAVETSFSHQFIQDCFPELADLVSFTERRQKYDEVLQVYNFRHALYSNNDPLIHDPLSHAKSDPAWTTVSSHPKRRNEAFRSSYDLSLRLAREHILPKVDKTLIQKFPRRIFVSRDSSLGINHRPMAGESELIRELRRNGFERLYFEHLSPLEQIAAIQAAESVVSVHGAFFAHMAYARPETHFVELANLQLQRHRWGDFLGNAHASGCRYSTVFADAAEDDPSQLRPISTGMSPVRIGHKAVSKIVEVALQPDLR